MFGHAPNSRWHAPAWAWIAAIATTLLVVWALEAASEAAPMSLLRHLFFVPITLAAVRFGPLAGMGCGALASLLAGPLAGPAALSVWLGRGAAFVAVGAVVGVAAAANAATAANARSASEVSERERALVAQRAALVQVVSHELRTPLTILRGTVETLVERESLVDPAARELVQAMDRSVTRLQEMMDVVLAAADELETDISTVGRIDVRDLVEHVVGSLQPRLQQRLRSEIPADAVVEAVESDLWLTLRCLLDNADKFSPDAGMINVSFHEEGGYALIRVEDEGPGLPEGFSESAFEPFRQADLTPSRLHPGLGMGLYTARRLARRMGGDVTIGPGEQRGCRATVSLPAARPVSARQGAASAPAVPF